LLVLGVDGGGTSTVAVVVNEKKELKGVGLAGPCRYHEIGIKAAQNNLTKAIDSAYPCQRITGQLPFEQAVFGIGGLDSEVDRNVIKKFVKSKKIACDSLIVNDVVIAFYATTLGFPGIVVVSGTGSIMYGSDTKNVSGLIGGWGWLIGDEGSAVYIARKALQEAAKISDGRREERTDLIDQILKYFEIGELREIISKLSAKKINLRYVSGFSKIVTQVAEKGDRVAREILKEAAIELVDGVEATAKRIFLINDFIVGCTGGVFRSKLLYHHFKHEVLARFPTVAVKDPIFYPVVGAIVMGLDRAGIKMNEREVEDLEKKITRFL
jgi:N-acetylglucosamine kinase-like BadF-type ATPase